ncbi:MAG: hypothetical protein AAGI44_18255 [Pseudomonadota bacterium]
MPRRAARVDDNHSTIVEWFRGMGCSVADTSAAGNGFPDLVVGQRGVSTLVEVKDGEKQASQQKLTGAQEKFHAEWRGSIFVVTNITEATEVVKYLNQCAIAQKKGGVKRP